MAEAHLILGVTRQDDDPRGPVSGLIYRDGDRLKWGALAVLFSAEPPPRFFRLVPDGGDVARQELVRVEYTVNRVPRFLFKQPDGKLAHFDLGDKLQFSEGKKSLLKPQRLSALPLPALAIEYLEVCRLNDHMKRELLSGERTIGQLAEVLGLKPDDKALNQMLYELARRRYLNVHELGAPADNAIGLDGVAPRLK